jgi:hypothetical protein
MKLEVGMYIRTKWGNICELININDFREPSMKYGVKASYLKDVMFIGDDDILKASYNITDLISVGDFVNEELVYARIGSKLYLNGDTGEIMVFEDGTADEPIRSIVTKEQFKKMIYEVNIKGLD